MNAIISGRSGRALLIEGDSLKSFEVDDPSTLTSRQQADLPYLFGEGSDLRILENTTREEVELKLKSNCNFTWALDLTLILLDAELPNDIRKEAAGNLEKLLEMNETLAQVKNVLYAQPLPEAADLKGALELCSSLDSSPVPKLLLDLERFQPQISKVCSAWESIPTSVFGSYEDREAFRAVAVSESLFQVLATEPPASTSYFNRMMTSSALTKLPNEIRVLRKWYELYLGTSPDVSKDRSKFVRSRLNRSYWLDGRPVRMKRELILKALRRCHGDHLKAARLLGISPRYLRKLMARSNDQRRRLNRLSI